MESPGARIPGVRWRTTNIEVDKDGNRVREYVSLVGTHDNCAGGKSPAVTCAFVNRLRVDVVLSVASGTVIQAIR